ncbi:MAG TPA: carboxypeptidase-like regulatory domain-containing protein [Acidobacteriaceae bacterium]|nr:carboxypeptidase-like regulatory domain-containing protein [Acidobacteriaceae bacterium]
MKTRTSEPERLPVLRRKGFVASCRLAVLSAVVGASVGMGLNFCVIPARAAGVPNSAEATKVPKPRTVEGEVRSRDGAPIQGAVVYLKDTRSLIVKSFLSDAAGRFHFRNLSRNEDYDLWAELEGRRSKTKSISHFESRADLHYTLKLDKGTHNGKK